ncbi:putative lipid II flippase FtsW [Geoalkalibacter halelectricus]|uniref:Probable peptidoglycan glycosyltransferase FtsW n=1 Tax=Geoalkalibacter halelectricus TaxID=2847045 RepID=A0ABY5ZPP8_9BACT|nr:putative lipid II flippase FtsW [Geoalkalibacter halelectricus]MDO3378829.1 putative lipid II flippase FtsW [Geoalkalibacter halelectricus]UWZ79865.1 putative lipid II flippase FtsW [Geoalkalibacter halelectricus]
MATRREFDTTILLLVVVLTCFGVVMVYSSSSIMAAKRFNDGFFFLKRQGLYAAAGFLIMAAAMHIDYRFWRRLTLLGLAAAVIFLIAVLIPGVGANVGGASRWLRFPGFSVQPAELAKLAMVFYLAHSLARKKDKLHSFKLGFLPYMLVVGCLLGLLLLQPDLGSAIVIAVVALTMLLVAGARLSYLLSVALMALPVLYLAIMQVDYRRRRILAFLDPWDDPFNTGFQILQSWTAFGLGGLLGKGLGEGQQKLFYLPEAHTDFIFSVVGEELGFIGVLVVTAMFLVFCLRGIRIAQQAPDDYGRHLAFGLTFLIGMGAFINMGVVLGLLPTKGLALPLLSYGGTSLLTTLFAVGVLLNISRQTGEVKA